MSGSGGESVSFDRAADYYDRTRGTDEASVVGSVDLLEKELVGRGRVLEIGVGTGALALPLAERGVPVVGVDLALPMMRKLVEKAGGRLPLPLAQADATRLPFNDGAFGAAYARWVLHLIPNWNDAIRELRRVVASRGTVVMSPGGYSGPWSEVWWRLIDELGENARPVGLDMLDSARALDEAFERAGAVPRPLPTVMVPDGQSLAGFFDEASQRLYSWTWRVSGDDLRRGIEVVRAWAAETYGDLDQPLQEQRPVVWRAYDIG